MASHLQVSPNTVRDYLRRLSDSYLTFAIRPYSRNIKVTGEKYDLYYVRNKQKQETDFLVVREGRPWLLLEAKLSDGRVERHHFGVIHALGGIPFVQVCRQRGVASWEAKGVYRVSADHLFA